MKNENKVLACVDQSRYAEFIADYASWAAIQMDAPLEFLHVIDRHPEQAKSGDLSGAIGIDSQDNLLTMLSSEDEALSKAAREHGRIFLNRLRERAINAGVMSADLRQRYGELEDTLVEQAQGVRLLVLGRRGQSADAAQGVLGSNVERVVRAMSKPILTVTDSFQVPRRAMIAFDGSTVTRRGVAMLANSPLFKGVHLHLLMSGKASQDAHKQLETAKTTLTDAGFSTSMALIPGDAGTIIAKSIEKESIDLLIMGAFNHSSLRSLVFGSKTADLLRTSTVPTLLLR